jgi:4-amino-4-deoxy-L-arabinose transferase-like glycosyltransferase
MIGLGALPLVGDEAYYWLWSQHPAPSYYDHPAGIALMIRAGTTLAGDGEFGIRWLNAMLGFSTIAAAMAVGRRLFARGAGVFTGAAIALGAPFLIVARFVYTDVLHLLGVLLNLWAFDALLAEDRRPSDAQGALFGLTLILLLNTKYSAYLYVAALGAWILLERRSLLHRRAFWIGVGMGGLGLLPVVLWNAAHDWVSFRWQLSHFGMASPGARALPLPLQLVANARHAWDYLTPPVFLAGIAGIGRLRRPRERLLTLAALGMLLPVGVSAANSPRNLTTGWVLLMMLAGVRVGEIASPSSRGLLARLTSGSGPARLLVAGLVVGLLVAVGGYGVGTVVALSGQRAPLSSSAVSDILQDAAGWRAFGDAMAGWRGAILTVDYSLAGQLTYYAEGRAVTPWGQYWLWDWPRLDPVLVVSREYLPADCVTAALRDTFQAVAGPEILRVDDVGLTRELRFWRAEGLQVDRAVLLQRLDFLTLQAVCR